MGTYPRSVHDTVVNAQLCITSMYCTNQLMCITSQGNHAMRNKQPELVRPSSHSVEEPSEYPRQAVAWFHKCWQWHLGTSNAMECLLKCNICYTLQTMNWLLANYQPQKYNVNFFHFKLNQFTIRPIALPEVDSNSANEQQPFSEHWLEFSWLTSFLRRTLQQGHERNPI